MPHVITYAHNTRMYACLIRTTHETHTDSWLWIISQKVKWFGVAGATHTHSDHLDIHTGGWLACASYMQVNLQNAMANEHHTHIIAHATGLTVYSCCQMAFISIACLCALVAIKSSVVCVCECNYTYRMVPEYRRQMPSFRHSIPIGMIFVKLTNAMIENTYNNKMMMLM